MHSILPQLSVTQINFDRIPPTGASDTRCVTNIPSLPGEPRYDRPGGLVDTSEPAAVRSGPAPAAQPASRSGRSGDQIVRLAPTSLTVHSPEPDRRRVRCPRPDKPPNGTAQACPGRWLHELSATVVCDAPGQTGKR